MSESVKNQKTNGSACGSEEIAAYLDGELDARSSMLFERHLSECARCSQKLREQKQLLCALDMALNDDPALTLPKDFARVVAVHAQSDMSAVREGEERRRALHLLAALLACCAALLGFASLSDAVSAPLRLATRYCVSLAGLLWHTLYDAGTGVVIILRAVGRRFLLDLHPLSLLAFLLFAIALVLLMRLITNYHRARVME